MVEALGRVMPGFGTKIEFGNSLNSIINEGSARINLAEFRPMTVGDIGVSPRPFGWAISQRSYEIQNQVRLERYAVIRENARVSRPMISIMSQIEEIADIAWKKTEPSKTEPVKDWASEVGTLLFWNELRAQPDVTDEILERAHRAKADLMNRKLAAMPEAQSKATSQPEARASSRVEFKPQAAPDQKVKTEGAVKSKVNQQEKKKNPKEAPKTKKSKLGTIIFKKDEPVSAYRLARAKNEFKILHQEKMGGIVKGVELNNRLGFEISSEKSRLLYQLGIKEREDGSNVRGFRRIIDRLLFNGLQDGYRKLYEANENHDPVMIGGDGKIESEEAVEEVLQGNLTRAYKSDKVPEI